MHLTGSSVQDIRAAVGCSANTVRLWIRKYEQGGLDCTEDHRKYNHQSRKATIEQDGIINEYFSQNPFSTSSHFINVVNADICSSTIRNCLHEMNIRNYVPVRRFGLSDRHRERRIAYAQQYGEEAEDFWANTVCVDKKCFKSSEDGRQRVWRPKDGRLDENFVVPIHHSGRITCNFWGCCSIYGVGVLREVRRGFNAEAYVDLLENDFLPYLNRIFPEDEYEKVKVIQDNSRIHTARVTRNWFEQQPRITFLPHPANSPDLNPIENLWGVMVRSWESG